LGPNNEVTVVAQYDPGQGIPTQRYIINKESPNINKESPNGPENYPDDGKDGWLILDNDEIPKMSDEDNKIVVGELSNIVPKCEGKANELNERLNKDPELKKSFGLKVDTQLSKEQEELLKNYFKTPEGLKKLSDDHDLRDLVFEFEVGKGKEERFREYKNTLEGCKDPLNKNTGDPMTLLQFIFWGINTFEATRYMVVLAGHGSGAVEDFLLKDENARDSLTLHELRDVFQLVQEKLRQTELKRCRKELEMESERSKRRELEQKLGQLSVQGQGPRLDILGMDSCLMSMAEVYFQLVGSVDYLVGAEGFEPGGGWPYQRILKSLADNPDWEPREFASRIVDDYVLYYFDYVLAGLSVDLSACKIVRADSLADAIGKLGEQLIARLKDRAGREIVISARQKAQPYKFDQYVDLLDFCDQLDELKHSDGKLIECCKTVRAAVRKEEIVKSSSYVGPDYQKSHGLSVYFPWISAPQKCSNGYEQLQFTQKTNRKWLEFVETFAETMRAIELAAPEEMTLPEGKTLYSARTLYSGRSLYSGRTSQGPGQPLYMAYSKAPSIVWKPKGSVGHHFQDLWWEETTNRITTAPGRKIYGQPESPEAKQKFEEVIRNIRVELTPDFYEKLDSPEAEPELRQIMESKGDIKAQIEELQSSTGIGIDAQTLTDSLLAARRDLTEYLGVDLVKPEARPDKGLSKGAGT
jgi:hypothetical protein